MGYDVCSRCETQSVAYDAASGVVVCESCGLVCEEGLLQNPDFNEDGRRVGTYISGRGTATSTMGSLRSGRGGPAALHGLGFRTDTKRKYTLDKLDELASILRLSKDKAGDVRHLLKLVTDEKWGAGQWMDILVGTCIYVVARRSRLPLSAAEISIAANCGVKELMRMYSRVTEHADIVLPGVDLAAYFDKALSHHEAFANLEKDGLRRLCRQGHLLLDCSAEWFLSTGRHPLAVVAAVVVIVAKANNIEKVDLDDISRDLHVHPQTSHLRLREFRESLVGIGQRLPWGKDITCKTVDRHLPFLLQYLQIKYQKSTNKKDTTIHPILPIVSVKGSSLSQEDVAVNHLTRALRIKYGTQAKQALSSQRYIVKEDLNEADIGAGGSCIEEVLSGPKRQKLVTHGLKKRLGHAPLEHRQTDQQCLMLANVTGIEQPEMSLEAMVNVFKEDEACTKLGQQCLMLTDVMDKEDEPCTKLEGPSKWDPLPPSFMANRAACSRRLMKIEMAKKRIEEAKQSMKLVIGDSGVLEHNEMGTLVELKKQMVSTSLCMDLHKEDKTLDTEDLLIEYLLLRGADEQLIEAGYYNLLLSSPPVQSDVDEMTDKELSKYFRSPSELKFLLSISQGEPLSPWLDFGD